MKTVLVSLLAASALALGVPVTQISTATPAAATSGAHTAGLEELWCWLVPKSCGR